jgi:tape measure domain-containing protein
MPTERIRIEVSQNGARAVRRDIEGLGAGAQTASRALGGLGTALKAAVAGAVVRETIRIADSYTNLSNRIRVVTRDEREMGAVRSELFRVANQTRGSVEDLTTVYGRLALSTKSLGLSQREVIELTESLQQATALGGASTQEAAAALVQLSQGLGAGALRGQELNSVLEQAPIIAQTIADHLKVNVGDLKAMGEQGKITGRDVVDAFKAARTELADRFGNSVPTVSSAITVLGNTVTNLVGELDGATGATGGLSKGIIGISEDINEAMPQIKILIRELTSLGDLRPTSGGLIETLFGDDSVRKLDVLTIAMGGLKNLGVAFLEAPTKGLEAFNEARDKTQALIQEVVGSHGLRLGSRFPEGEGPPLPPGHKLIDPLAQRSTPKPSALSTAGSATKGPTAASILADLQRENELLQMGNERRQIESALDQVRSQLKGKLSQQQEEAIRTQLEANRVQEFTNDAVEKGNQLQIELSEKAKGIQRVFDDRMTGLREERMLMSLSTSEREIQIELLDAQREAENRLTAAQLRALEVELRRNQTIAAMSAERDEMPKDFLGASDFMGDQFLADVRSFGQEMAIIFGPGGTLQSGLQGVAGSLADAAGHAIAFGEPWRETEEVIKNIGRSIVAEIISSLIKIPIQMAINETIASGLRAKATAETVAQATATSAAWAPAAAGASLATAGGNSIGATAAIVGISALALGTLAGAALFEEGGYTGDGSRSGVAGLVHGKEFVLHADATSRYRGEAEAMNAGTYRPGGGGAVSVTIVDQTDGATRFETRQLSESEVEIIVRRVAPSAVADDLRSPQSRVGRAMSQTTTSKRVRT